MNNKRIIILSIIAFFFFLYIKLSDYYSKNNKYYICEINNTLRNNCAIKPNEKNIFKVSYNAKGVQKGKHYLIIGETNSFDTISLESNKINISKSRDFYEGSELESIIIPNSGSFKIKIEARFHGIK